MLEAASLAIIVVVAYYKISKLEVQQPKAKIESIKTGIQNAD